jgi:hypothetical protein
MIHIISLSGCIVFICGVKFYMNFDTFKLYLMINYFFQGYYRKYIELYCNLHGHRRDQFYFVLHIRDTFIKIIICTFCSSTLV